MNRLDLMREYIKVVELCKDTALESTPWMCVRLNGNDIYAHPTFTNAPEGYAFAIAVVEDKPVFVGDKLWVYVNCREREVKVHQYFRNSERVMAVDESTGNLYYLLPRRLTWNSKSPRVFSLNGEELPCPKIPQDYGTTKPSKDNRLKLDDVIFYFNSIEDKIAVTSAIINMLRNASEFKG